MSDELVSVAVSPRITRLGAWWYVAPYFTVRYVDVDHVWYTCGVYATEAQAHEAGAKLARERGWGFWYEKRIAGYSSCEHDDCHDDEPMARACAEQRGTVQP